MAFGQKLKLLWQASGIILAWDSWCVLHTVLSCWCCRRGLKQNAVQVKADRASITM